MIPVVVYPIPFDAFNVYERFVRRFIDSFKKYHPGVENYVIAAVCNWGEPTDEIREWFWGTKTQFLNYYNNGCDIGSLQHAHNWFGCYSPLYVAMTSRCYIHRDGWLKRYVEAYDKHGSGLYGASASWEGGKPHICTRAYAIDGPLLGAYPHHINTRSKGQRFETGDWSITDWVQDLGLPTIQVTWDGYQDQDHWRDPSQKGIYRRGEQNEMLVWDKHTDAFRDADAEEKLRLASLADPK